MKKHRLTKITIKTREIISLPKNAADEVQNSICPICHAPLTPYLPDKADEVSTENESESTIKLLEKITGQK